MTFMCCSKGHERSPFLVFMLGKNMLLDIYSGLNHTLTGSLKWYCILYTHLKRLSESWLKVHHAVSSCSHDLTRKQRSGMQTNEGGAEEIGHLLELWRWSRPTPLHLTSPLYHTLLLSYWALTTNYISCACRYVYTPSLVDSWTGMNNRQNDIARTSASRSRKQNKFRVCIAQGLCAKILGVGVHKYGQCWLWQELEVPMVCARGWGTRGTLIKIE